MMPWHARQTRGLIVGFIAVFLFVLGGCQRVNVPGYLVTGNAGTLIVPNQNFVSPETSTGFNSDSSVIPPDGLGVSPTGPTTGGPSAGKGTALGELLP